MICSHCGAEISETANFCKYCGAQKGASVAPSSAVSPLDETQEWYDRDASPRAQAYANTTAPEVPNPVVAAPQKKPSDYLLANIAATVLCCSPLSIVGIIFAAISRGETSSGDFVKGASHARAARICFWTGLILSAIVNIVFSVVLRSIDLPVEDSQKLEKTTDDLNDAVDELIKSLESGKEL